jgi:hypothetical protein
LKHTVEEIVKQKLRGSHYESLINIILKHFIKFMMTVEKIICDEYIQNFNDLIGCLSVKYKINIPNDLIEYSFNLGKFGQTLINRRFSGYFCTCLIRVRFKY